MIRPRRAILVALAAGIATAAFTPSAWRYRKRIPLTAGDALAVVKLDREVYTRARDDLADLRVLRDGDEIPYLLETLTATSQQREQRAEVLDQSVMPGTGLEFTLRLGGSFKHNRVRLETGERNFRQAVRISTSEDGKRWSVARADGAVFDFSQGDRRISALSVDYPVSTRPFLRVTVSGWNKVGALTAAFVDYREDHPASREELATVVPQLAEDAKTQSTLATLDLGVEGLPVDHVRVDATSPSFHRAVDLETSRDGKDWPYLTQAVITRVVGAESLVIGIPETRRRYLRLRVYNRDDKPLAIEKIHLDGVIRRVKFPIVSSGIYWLYFGNPDAKPAGYDLPALPARREHIAEASWTAGPAEPNPDYRAPPPPAKPWSETHPAILYTVLGGAVLGLGVATLRFASRLRRPS